MGLYAPQQGVVHHFYVPLGFDEELCFNIGATKPLTGQELDRIKVCFQENPTQEVRLEPKYLGPNVIEIGPRRGRETSFSSMASRSQYGLQKRSISQAIVR